MAAVTYQILDQAGVIQWACRDGGYADAYGCRWRLTEESGWMGVATPRSNTTPRPYEDGDYDGTTYQSGRTITLAGVVTAPSQSALHQSIDAAAGLLATRDRRGVLRVDEPHISRQAVVRRDDEFLLERTHPNLGRFSLQLFAADPRRYGTLPSQGATGLPSFGDGWDYAYSYGYAYGAAGTSGNIDAYNAGTAETWPTFTIYGPVLNPTITNVITGQQLAFEMNLLAGQTLVISAAAKTVRLNDQASRRDALAARAEWWPLTPGSNPHQFNARSSDGGASLTVQWQNAWA